jgi:hypothetical protein
LLASLNTLGSNFVVVRDNWLTCDRPEARDLFISDLINGEMTDAFQTLMMNISTALVNKVWVNPDPDEEEHFPYEVASQVEDAAFAFQ